MKKFNVLLMNSDISSMSTNECMGMASTVVDFYIHSDVDTSLKKGLQENAAALNANVVCNIHVIRFSHYLMAYGTATSLDPEDINKKFWSDKED